MSAPPYMKLFWGDYVSCTRHLTRDHHGALMLLLGAVWSGSAVNDDASLAEITCSTPDEWEALRHVIMPFFSVQHRRLQITPSFQRLVNQPDERRPYSPLWMALRAAVLERDGYTCSYCGTADGSMEADHVVPVISGGQDVLDNLVCACRTCNRSKGSKSVSEWMASA